MKTEKENQLKPTSALEIAKSLEKTMQCNCDLDNWTPDSRTDHSFVCRIHNVAISRWDDIQKGRTWIPFK